MPKSKQQKREEAATRLEANIAEDEKKLKVCKDDAEQAANWRANIAKAKQELTCIRAKLKPKTSTW